MLVLVFVLVLVIVVVLVLLLVLVLVLVLVVNALMIPLVPSLLPPFPLPPPSLLFCGSLGTCATCFFI